MLFSSTGPGLPDGHHVDNFFHQLFLNKNVITQHTHKVKSSRSSLARKFPGSDGSPCQCLQKIPLHPLSLVKNFGVYILQTANTVTLLRNLADRFHQCFYIAHGQHIFQVVNHCQKKKMIVGIFLLYRRRQKIVFRVIVDHGFR